MSLAGGLHAEGVRIFDAGICPTPATAVAIRVLGLDMGFVITASHNPATDNGIKLFGPGGCKLQMDQELEIEALIDSIQLDKETNPATPPVRNLDARRHYLETYENLLPQNALVGMRIVLDCANGAAFRTTPELLRKLGAKLFLIGVEPDGTNINEGVGSEEPDVLAKAVLQQGADLGIAHDGDGDRVILCDHTGKVLDGDAVLAILGTGWAQRGCLKKNTIVATIMSNLGLDDCLAESGVAVERVGVGDRQVFYSMRDNGYVLGGESSGHFIAMEHLPTGDGLLATLLVLNEVIKSGKTLAELGSVFKPFPQIKKNLPVTDKPVLEELAELQSELVSMEKRLGKSGRILLRYSGTEPKVRLLAEAADKDLAEITFSELEDMVMRHLPVAM